CRYVLLKDASPGNRTSNLLITKRLLYFLYHCRPFCTHTHTDTHRHTPTDPHTPTPPQHTPTHTHTHNHTHTHPQTHTDTKAHAHTHTRAHMITAQGLTLLLSSERQEVK